MKVKNVEIIREKHLVNKAKEIFLKVFMPQKYEMLLEQKKMQEVEEHNESFFTVLEILIKQKIIDHNKHLSDENIKDLIDLLRLYIKKAGFVYRDWYQDLKVPSRLDAVIFDILGIIPDEDSEIIWLGNVNNKQKCRGTKSEEIEELIEKSDFLRELKNKKHYKVPWSYSDEITCQDLIDTLNNLWIYVIPKRSKKISAFISVGYKKLQTIFSTDYDVEFPPYEYPPIEYLKLMDEAKEKSR